MPIRPNRSGPFCPFGEIAVTSAGTAVPLDTNFDTGFKYDPNAPVTETEPQQYSLGCEDIIINSSPDNNGGLYLVQYNKQGAAGSKNDTDKILLYIPQHSGPLSIKKYLGGARFNPSMIAIDADQDGDVAWVVGIIGT